MPLVDAPPADAVHITQLRRRRVEAGVGPRDRAGPLGAELR